MNKVTVLFRAFKWHRWVWLWIVLLLVLTSLCTFYLLASQSTVNPWVTFPIYQSESSSDVTLDWPLVAWIDWLGFPDPPRVFMKNLETGLIQDLTSYLSCPPVGSGRGDLALYGEWLVGSFSCNYPYSYEIHALNLNSHELIMIPTPSGIPPEQTYATEPAIYGQYIIWQQEDWTVGRSDIFLFDLQSHTVISITQTLAPIIEVHPEIHQDWVAWNSLDLTSGDNFIALLNLNSSEQITIPLAFSYDTEISLDDQFIIWTDFRNGSTNADVYGYDLGSRQEFPVITGPNHQGEAVISDGLVVYRDQGPPISLYVHHIATQETYYLFEELPDHNIHRIKSFDNGVVVWSDGTATGPQATVYGAQQLPNRFFLPILRRP